MQEYWFDTLKKKVLDMCKNCLSEAKTYVQLENKNRTIPFLHINQLINYSV